MTNDTHQQTTGALVPDALEVIAGTDDATRLIVTLCGDRTSAPADALHDALLQVLATGSASRLRGFCRQCQKALERTAR